MCLAGLLLVGSLHAGAGALGAEPARVALIVGNSAYQNVAPLSNAVNDARGLCAKLRALKFQTDCVENTASRRELRTAVERFAAALKPGDVALFYYAGHGVQRRNVNYLVPTGAQFTRVADIEDENLSLSYVLEAVSEARASLNLIVLDACREDIVPKALEPYLPKKGFAEVDPPPGTMIVYASEFGKFALDGEPNGNSPFTKHLLAHIDTAGLKLEDLLKKVIQGVQQDTQRRQRPSYGSSYAGTFCFADCEDPEKASQLARLLSEKQEVESRLRLLEADRTMRQQEVEALQKKVATIQQATQPQTPREVVERSNALLGGGVRSQQEIDKLNADRETLRAANQQLDEERRKLKLQQAEMEGLARQSELLEERRRQIVQLETENTKLRSDAAMRERALLDLQEKRRVELQSGQAPRRVPAMPIPTF